jgi:formamidopyrimidine-DNA glycosylase
MTVLDEFFEHLGLEPFTSTYELQAFLTLMKGRETRIKTLLLNQSFVAGVGNIYADEALFESGIHPARRVNRLRVYEKKSLFEAIPRVLERGIRFGGTTVRDFINSEGTSGDHQQKLNVYGREGRPCRFCESALRKIVVSQRGTHFCPICQPRSGPGKERF